MTGLTCHEIYLFLKRCFHQSHTTAYHQKGHSPRSSAING
uniref:Uncharacterized protein n=1 Tax=Arundo donax TaxID=35708 RepID=A0A0A9AFR9_ARUDO